MLPPEDCPEDDPPDCSDNPSDWLPEDSEFCDEDSEEPELSSVSGSSVVVRVIPFPGRLIALCAPDTDPEEDPPLAEMPPLCWLLLPDCCSFPLEDPDDWAFILFDGPDD